MPTRPSYAVAVATTAAAWLLRSLLGSWPGSDALSLSFFLPAVLIAAWYGGAGPGLLSALLSTLVAMYFFLPPAGFAVAAVADWLSLLLFALTSLGIVGLSYQLSAAARLAVSRARRLDAIIETTVDGIIVIGADGRIEAFNPAAERLFGYAEADVLGRNVDVLMPSPYREEHSSYLARYLATGEAKVIGIGREVTGRRSDETTFPVHLSVGQFVIEGEPKFTGILHDLSGRVRMEERLREHAALARLGEMAAVVAHEVKNPLAGIRGAVQVLGSRLPSSASEAPVMKAILERIDALDRLMKELLLFARPPEPRRRPTDVVALVAATAQLMRQDPSMQDVRVEVEGASPLVMVDPEMLQIVLQNLLLNSAHAMQGHGRISVQVAAVDGTCCLAVVDAGPGIPADIRDRIFAPFFTTKARGSGLGLATAKRFVEAHDGEIALDSPESGGARFVVRLPLAETDQRATVPHAEP